MAINMSLDFLHSAAVEQLLDSMIKPSGLFFVPGIDIGLVYSAGMTELMCLAATAEALGGHLLAVFVLGSLVLFSLRKAKLPTTMWNDACPRSCPCMACVHVHL